LYVLLLLLVFQYLHSKAQTIVDGVCSLEELIVLTVMVSESIQHLLNVHGQEGHKEQMLDVEMGKCIQVHLINLMEIVRNVLVQGQ